MAARRNLKHDQETREKIQTSQLVNRLTDHANGTVEMTSTQVKAAEILLRKSLPDLSSVTVGGDEENPLSVNLVGIKALLDEKLARFAGS